MFAALGKNAECSGKDHLPAVETGVGHPGGSQVAGIFRLCLRNASGVRGVRCSAFGVWRSKAKRLGLLLQKRQAGRSAYSERFRVNFREADCIFEVLRASVREARNNKCCC